MAENLPDLRIERPNQYHQRVSWPDESDESLYFDIRSDDDFDWLYSKILDHGYYQQDGCWSMHRDRDKFTHGHLLAAFEPKNTVELGCSIGAVMEGLIEHNIDCFGLELSERAKMLASPRCRPRIQLTDLLSFDTPIKYDLIYGLDILEHLNPNMINIYLRRVYELLSGEGIAYFNIPVFGDDLRFETMPLYQESWNEDIRNDRIFQSIHCDSLGYPIHGHLIWASSDWWVQRFEQNGLYRCHELERTVHSLVDEEFMANSPYRRMFYVLRKGSGPVREDACGHYAESLGKSMPTLLGLEVGKHVADSRAPEGLAAEIQIQAPENAVKGSIIDIHCYVKNTGNASWLPSSRLTGPVNLGIQLLSKRGTIIDYNYWRAHLPGDRIINPGEDLSWQFAIQVPNDIGQYKLVCDLVAEGVVWFSECQPPGNHTRICHVLDVIDS